MYTALLLVFGLLGVSMGVPLEDTYDPQGFLGPMDQPAEEFYNPRTFLEPAMGIQVETSNAHQESASWFYEPTDFYGPMGLPIDPQGQSSRIVGGTDAPDGISPHMVALLTGVNIKSFFCGAALIAPDLVATAAHCIDPMVTWDGTLLSSFHGQIGSNLISSGYTEIRFARHQNHPEWDRWNIKSDIGLLHLVEKIPKRVAKPISLSFKWTGGGERVRVTGWGRLTVGGWLPDRLQQLKLTTLSPEECEERVRQANVEQGFSPPVHKAVELCTKSDLGPGQGMCNGDSGSAVVNKRGKAVGLVSWGWPCARGYPDVHARISGFEDWLRPTLALAGVVIEDEE